MDRPTAEIEKLEACVERDVCEREDCVYYLTPPEVAEVLRYIEELEEKTNTYSHLEGNHE